MKGQAVFEFIIASMILFSIIIYTISYLSSSFAMHHGISKTSDLEAKALRVSDMLASDNGARIFSDWPNLDAVKMAGVQTRCADPDDGYFKTVESLGLRESSPADKYNRLQITVVGANGHEYVDCGRSPVESAASGTATRFGYAPAGGGQPSQLAAIKVTVW